MGSAGLPGTGLGGLFYLLLALWLPVRELYLTARGRSVPGRWRAVWTQFALAVGILVAVVATVLLGRGALDLAPALLAWGLVPPLLLAVLAVVLRGWAALAGADRPDDRG